MPPLAHTLDLLAMVRTTAAIKEMPLDMAQDSFDDQYRGCGPAITMVLSALNHSEFQKNFVLAWAIAIMAYSMSELYTDFKAAMHVARHSPQEYRDNFHYKTLHFLMTQALAMLRDVQKGPCLDVVRRDCDIQYEAQRGDSIRFGLFIPMWLRESSDKVMLMPPFETFEVTEYTQEGDKKQIPLCSTGTSSKYNCKWLKGDATGGSLGG
ncbi:hypothetical protein HGM15179_013011 [Zosterops borbonicus]|uniref:NAD(P)(+)--arginine ADP-ribosyltransferase n=1 Tax=Zosterops borbonicus TaxID=364589 RepID=A0A8K1LHC8_9PASS|nr:hypothetical protein HGM15179_013011 [Zosterops borbonicus]